MTIRHHFKFVSRSLADTQTLARVIGHRLSPGALLMLNGDLGSGKTSFVQGLAQGLEVPEHYYVTSPTFTLINEYPGKYDLYHIDLYRIDHPDALDDIGFYDIISGYGVVAVEWADKFRSQLPTEFLELKFEIMDENSRHIVITATGLEPNDLLKKLEPILKERKWD